MNELDNHLEAIDKDIQNNPQNIEFLKKERREMKTTIGKYLLEKAKGAHIRSRAKWIEKST